MLELHRATPWRISGHPALREWIQAQTWWELFWGDLACERICSETPKLDGFPVSLLEAVEDNDEQGSEMQSQAASQVMHRLLFASDLCRRMRGGARKEVELLCGVLTGHFAHDAKIVLVHAWRTNVVLWWADEFGSYYLGDDDDDS
jgi:hypothetical protein